MLAAHMDTLGAMVTEIKSNGRLKLTNVGGMNANNAEAENCRVFTRNGSQYDATFQLTGASIHVNGEYSDTKRTYDTMEAILDELVHSKEDVEKLGVMPGDFVCFDPRTKVTDSGFIKSRFLDDKLSTAILLGFAKYLKEENVLPERTVYLLITSYEEVGHGCAYIPEEIEEFIAVDMGCIGKDLSSTERAVSICAKDSSGPYDYQMTTTLINLAKDNELSFAVDIYPFYSSDVSASLRGGQDIRGALIGPGVAASHGMERSHVDAVENTMKLLIAYVTKKD